MGDRRGLSWDEETKPEREVGGDRRLLIFGPEGVVSHPLLDGTYSVGRGIDADIQLDDPTLSRRHIALEADGSNISVTDLGSRNGTRLRGQEIEANRPIPVKVGDLIDIGNTTVVIQAGGVSLDQPRRVFSHDHFELRLEEECRRARNTASEFSVLRIRADGISGQQAEATISTLLGPQDLVGRYAPSEYEVILAGIGPAEVEEAAGGIRFGLSRLGAKGNVGVACFPRDGQTPQSLISRAGEEAHPKAPSTDTDLILASDIMKNLFALVDRIAVSDISVLVLGETGVGKEILAGAIHARSRRTSGPFMPLNCGAFSQELLESELFGHERGAFTGAVKTKPGLLEVARGGTVFLDEVAEMSLSTQVKLLRVLEERQMRSVGSVEVTPIDVRIVAATNKNLEVEVKNGRFREDLYYRLNGISMVVPPLRDRTEEVSVFAQVFAEKTAAREGLRTPSISNRALRVLEEYAWPGNVRELRNVIERAVVLAGGATIDLDHLPMEKLSTSVIFAPTLPIPASDPSDIPPDSATRATIEVAASSLKEEMESLERARIVQALEECGGNQSRAAKLLGMSRKALLRRLVHYDIPRPGKGRD